MNDNYCNVDPKPNIIWNSSYFIAGTATRRVLRVTLCPVVGRPRPAVITCRTVRSGMFHHWIHHLWPQGAVSPGFNPLRRGWVYRPAPEAPRKGECRLSVALGFDPATGPTLKTALCHIRTLVGRMINIGTATRMKSQGITPAFCYTSNYSYNK